MERILTELNLEEEVTAQMYISGMEKKEIAEKKCRAISTIVNQLQTVFKKMDVTNGRELSRKFYERLNGVGYTFNFSSTTRSVIASFLFGVFVFSMYNGNNVMKRGKNIEIEEREVKNEH